MTEKSFIEFVLSTAETVQGSELPDGADLPRLSGDVPHSETFKRTHRRPA